MSYRFEDITEKNVDDLMSVCGNMPGMDKNPHFNEGRAARRQWIVETVGKYGTAGMLAYGDDDRAMGFVESIPATAHPLGRFAADVPGTMVIDCAWYRREAGLSVRKAILDEMFARRWFDQPLGDQACRYVDVLTLKSDMLMQYDFYAGYGFKDAVEITGHATTRYLLRFPVKGDEVVPRKEAIDFVDAGKNVLVTGIYRQCHMSFVFDAKIRKALEGVDGLTIKTVDYWSTGNPTICEAAINGKPAFDGAAPLMSEEQIRESVRAKMI